MCRMLAFTGRTSSMLDILLQFQKLSLHGKSTDSKGHRDGWGIGYYTGNTITLFKKAECAATSGQYMTAVETVVKRTPHVLMAHLRKASPGTPVTIKETHPFKVNTHLFCHNGSIYRPDGTPLGKELDSILFFKKIMESSLKEAVFHFRNCTYTSLTCLLTDGSTIWAYRDFREKEEYYTLYYMKTDEFVLFCSEPLLQKKWTLLENGELVTCYSDGTILRERL